jgi:hypothetical protein
MSFVLTTSQACIYKAGANYNSIFNQQSGHTIIAKFCDQAEAQVGALTRRDWVALSASTITTLKGILDDVVSDMVAMKIINYDMKNYTSRQEATTMLDVIRDNIERNIKDLKDGKIQEEMY